MTGLSELHKAHRESAEKYIYFLLAAAGAAIAFAVTQTQSATLTWIKLPLGLAVLCWGASFFCGCRQINQTANILQRNYQMLRVKAGEHPEFPNHPEAIAFIEKDLEAQVSKSGRWGLAQFRFLIAGAALYVLWHVFDMMARTPNVVAIWG